MMGDTIFLYSCCLYQKQRPKTQTESTSADTVGGGGGAAAAAAASSSSSSTSSSTSSFVKFIYFERE